MTHEAKIHTVQTAILRELLFVPSARFSDLQKTTGLDSDHFKFHVGRLAELGYIAKSSRGEYSLTSSGKEYANKLDTDKSVIERQPKSAVILVIQNGLGQLLVQERLKHPYFGFWGFPGGKIRWGETIIEAASRELMEEAGISVALTYKGVYHEHVRAKETDEIIEDKIFHVVYGQSTQGIIVEDFEGGRNAWLAAADIRTKGKVYKSFDTELEVGMGQQNFIELTQVYTTNQF